MNAEYTVGRPYNQRRFKEYGSKNDTYTQY